MILAIKLFSLNSIFLLIRPASGNYLSKCSWSATPRNKKNQSKKDEDFNVQRCKMTSLRECFKRRRRTMDL